MASWRDVARYGLPILGAATGGTIGFFTAGPAGAIKGAELGAGVGGGVAAGIGSDYTKEQKEQLDLARKMIYGPVDPVAAQALQTAIGRRYDQLRRQQGGDIARRGLMQSTIGSNVIGRTYDEERQALAQALAAQRFGEKQLGIQLLTSTTGNKAALDAQRAQLTGEIFSNIAQYFTLRNTTTPQPTTSQPTTPQPTISQKALNTRHYIYRNPPQHLPVIIPHVP